MGKPIVTIEWVNSDEKAKRRYHDDGKSAPSADWKSGQKINLPATPPKDSNEFFERVFAGESFAEASKKLPPRPSFVDKEDLDHLSKLMRETTYARDIYWYIENGDTQDKIKLQGIQTIAEMIKMKMEARRLEYDYQLEFEERAQKQELQRAVTANRAQVLKAAARWGLTPEVYEQVVLKSLDAKFSAELDLRKLQIELEQARRNLEMKLESDRHGARLDVEKARALADIEAEKARRVSEIQVLAQKTIRENKANREVRLGLLNKVLGASQRYYDLKAYGANKKEIQNAKKHLDDLEARWERLSRD